MISDQYLRDSRDRRQAVPRREGHEPARRPPAADEGAKVSLRAVMFRADGEVVLDGDQLEKVKVEARSPGTSAARRSGSSSTRPKKGYRKRQGHRSELTRLEVTDVKLLDPQAGGEGRGRAEPAEKAEASRRRRRSRQPRSPRPRQSPQRRSRRPRSPLRRSPLPRSRPAAARRRPRARPPRRGVAHLLRRTADGSQEGTRLEPQRPRLEPEDASGSRSSPARRSGAARSSSASAAPASARRRHRPRPRPHDLRHPPRHGRVPAVSQGPGRLRKE